MITLATRLAAPFIWRNRGRKVQVLLRFGRTEAGGAVDIARAAAAIDRPGLNRHLVRHIADEERHAEMFRRRAREVFGDPDGRTPAPESPGSDLEPTSMASERGDLALTDHGFVPSDHYAALGEVQYIAMLYLAECDAARDFAIHYAANRHTDPETADVFRRILRDEEYHCAYTRAQLAEWRAEGRAREVDRALRKMRWFRFKTRYLQLAQRFGDAVGGLVLRAVYVTLFLPFGVVGRSLRPRVGWLSPRPSPAPAVERLRSPA